MNFAFRNRKHSSTTTKEREKCEETHADDTPSRNKETQKTHFSSWRVVLLLDRIIVFLVIVNLCSLLMDCEPDRKVHKTKKMEKQSQSKKTSKPSSLKSDITLPSDYSAQTFSKEKLSQLETILSSPLHAPRNCSLTDKTVRGFCATYYYRAVVGKCEKVNREEAPIISTDETCKTLWFAGFDLGASDQCRIANDNGYGHKLKYAAALASARYFAKDTLQPVLLLGGKEVDAKFRNWAIKQGAIVIHVQTSSFQEELDAILAALQSDGRNHTNADRMSPFMRFNVPDLIAKHNLFGLSGVCQRHVLWTDVDVLFANPITHSDMAHLKRTLPPMNSLNILYGRGSQLEWPKTENLGVMFFDAQSVAPDWKTLLAFGRNVPDLILKAGNKPDLIFKAGAKVSDWFNHFYEKNLSDRHLRAVLPMYWNWRIYWQLDPSEITDLKIIHYEGLPTGDLMRKVSVCDTNITFADKFTQKTAALTICCGLSKVPFRFMQLFDLFLPDSDDRDRFC
jgi:hypothetical protein